MKVSSDRQVRELYENSADGYAEMMDSEISLPIYADTLGRLAERIANLSGAVLDTSCGSGHMLSKYGEAYDPDRALLGIDLSPRMVTVANARLNPQSRARVGDMRQLDGIEPDSVAALLSFFALHHVGPADAIAAFREWHRVLESGGQLVVAAWEGSGPIDYGEHSDVVALRYTESEVKRWAEACGFVVNRSVVEPVGGFPMDAIYLEATRL